MALNTHTSGIYSITNTVNGKMYVGSACNLKKRKLTPEIISKRHATRCANRLITGKY